MSYQELFDQLPEDLQRELAGRGVVTDNVLDLAATIDNADDENTVAWASGRAVGPKTAWAMIYRKRTPLILHAEGVNTVQAALALLIQVVNLPV